MSGRVITNKQALELRNKARYEDGGRVRPLPPPEEPDDDGMQEIVTQLKALVARIAELSESQKALVLQQLHAAAKPEKPRTLHFKGQYNGRAVDFTVEEK